jgi:hypothetical protein
MVGAALLLAAVLSTPGPFALVNKAGATLEALSIRPADSSGSWRPLGGGVVPSGARAAMPAPGGDLCAFDLRATLADTVVIWPSVNLCEVRTVTLNRRPDGTLWVDYD